MGEVVPFPLNFDRSVVAQLKRDKCRVALSFTVDPETAFAVLVTLSQLGVSLEDGSVVIVKSGKR